MSSSKQFGTLNMNLCGDESVNQSPKVEVDLDSLFDKTMKRTKTVLLPLLRKFIYILKKDTGFYKFKSLNENGFVLLNDKSHFPVVLESKNVFFYFSIKPKRF